MRIDNLYSTPRRPRLTITEAWLIEEPIYQQFRRAGRLLIERTEGQVLTNKQITDIFAMAEKGMNDAGTNRTLIGKGKDVVTDVASAINKAYQGVAQKISQSGPVSGFDVAVDKLTDKIKDAAGGDQGVVMQAINKYREFAKKHPVMQGAVYAGLIALAGISGAGLGGAALLGGIKAFDKLLQGNKASSALWSGFVTGATAYGLSKAIQAFGEPRTGAGTGGETGPPTGSDTGEIPGVTVQSGDLPTYKIQPGDTLSQIAQQQNVSVKDLMQANPGITDPNKIIAGQTLEIPAPTGNPIYQDGIGLGGPMPTASAPQPGISFPPGTFTGGDTGMLPGEVAQQAAQQGAQGAAQAAAPGFVYDSVTGEMVPADSEIAQAIRSGVRESRQQRRKVQRLSEMQINRLFRKVSSRLVMESLMEYTGDQRVAPGAQPAGGTSYGQTTAMPTKPAAVPGAGTNPQPAAAAAAAAPAAAAKPGLMSRLGSGLKTLGKQFTTKVTPEKLKMNWKVAGSPTDSEAVAFFLVNQGVSPDVVKGIYAQMKITPPTKGKFAPEAPAADAQGGAAAGAEQPAAAAGAEQPAAGAAQPAAAAAGAAQPAAAAGAVGAEQPAAPAAAAAGATPGKPSANEFATQLTKMWTNFVNAGGSVGSPAVKAALGDMWRQTGGTSLKEYTDDEYEQAKRDFFARGGEVIQEPYKQPRLKTRLRRMGSRHIGLGKEPRAGQLAGRGANVGGAGKPVVANEDLKWSKKFDPAARLWENLHKTRP